MVTVYQIALDTLTAGAPGLSVQTREVLAGIIARKVALTGDLSPDMPGTQQAQRSEVNKGAPQ